MKWSCPGLIRSLVNHVYICILKILEQIPLVLRGTVPKAMMPLIHILLNPNSLASLCFYVVICKMEQESYLSFMLVK